MESRIIKNIYYLLCYAWNKLEIGDPTAISEEDYSRSVDLYARVLVNGCNYLFKKGLDRNYVPVTEEYPGIKGKIDFNSSLRRITCRKGMAICTFDHFDHDILQNRLLKATLKLVLNEKDLDSSLKEEIFGLYSKFPNVQDIRIQSRYFTMVNLTRNNSHYDFLLKLCRLITENISISTGEGKCTFMDFTGNEQAMGALFEAFVRNFFDREQNGYAVGSKHIDWDIETGASGNLSFLPIMRTDVTLESGNRKIIIDTKYYASAFTRRYEAPKFHSSNLYQIYSYLRNSYGSSPASAKCEGILLYPSNKYSLNETYMISGHKITIRTLDLNREWREIHNDLLQMIA